MTWEWAENLFEKILLLLPRSPFQQFMEWFTDLPYISFLNWFFPVGECLAVMGVWLIAVALFYVYSIIMRWIKIIGD